MNNKKVMCSGFQIVSKMLDFPIPESYIIKEDKLPNKEITGIYSFKDNEIIFNEDWIYRSEWVEVIITAFHEMRHAYQGYCIRTRTRESKETLEIWEGEFQNYVMPSGKNNEIDDITYLKQDIEIDAIAFTHQYMNQIFKVKTIIPTQIKQNVLIKLNVFI